MAAVKKYFVSLKHIAPSDLEYYLEEMASSGYALKPFTESGLIYFEFEEVRTERVRYVVDITGLQKQFYMGSLLDRGWEYLGQSFNCHIWRKGYVNGKRPEDFADNDFIRKHCIRLGIAFALLSALVAVLIAGYAYLIWKAGSAHKIGLHELVYGVLTLVHLPIALIGIRSARELFREAAKRRQSFERNREFRKRQVNNEQEVLEYEKAGDHNQD